MRRSRTTPVALVALLLLAACGGGGDKADVGKGDGPTTTLAPFAPLTGLPLADQAKLRRPALIVKVENAPASRPQSGLDAADVVVEEIVEGGITRFLAVYHSADAEMVGPVRSVRPSDPDIAAPFGGLFAYSGGIPSFIQALQRTPGITDVGVDKLDEGADKPYFRRPGRSAPSNLYTATPRLYAKAPSTGTKPPGRFADFLPEGQAFGGAGASPATTLNLTVGKTAAAFEYDAASKTYRRAGLVEGAGVVAAANVIVQFTRYVETDETDQSDTTVEKANTVGSGEALILSGGLVVRGKWSKSSASAYTTWTDSTGAPIRLAPGRTWIELPRTGDPFTIR